MQHLDLYIHASEFFKAFCFNERGLSDILLMILIELEFKLGTRLQNTI